jgi:hypothetical protein
MGAEKHIETHLKDKPRDCDPLKRRSARRLGGTALARESSQALVQVQTNTLPPYCHIRYTSYLLETEYWKVVLHKRMRRKELTEGNRAVNMK